MRFPRVFIRQVGGSGSPVLGTDSVPTSNPSQKSDNQLASSVADSGGYPVHRIAVAYSYSGAASPAPVLPADLYMFELQTGAWYLVNEQKKMLRPGRISFFDVVGIARQPPRPSTDPLSYSSHPGGIEVALVVGVGPNSNGIYKFAMAADLTTLGGEQISPSEPANSLLAITPSDGTPLPNGPCRGIYVGGTAGNIVLIDADGNTETVPVTSFSTLNVKAQQVKATGTTATPLFAIY